MTRENKIEKAGRKSRRFLKRKKQIFLEALENLKRDRPNLTKEDLKNYREAFDRVWTKSKEKIFDKVLKSVQDKNRS